MRAESIGAIDELPPMFAILVFLNRRTKRFDEAYAAAKRGIELCRQTPELRTKTGIKFGKLTLLKASWGSR
jgi:hypothetical protein